MVKTFQQKAQEMFQINIISKEVPNLKKDIPSEELKKVTSEIFFTLIRNIAKSAR